MSKEKQLERQKQAHAEHELCDKPVMNKEGNQIIKGEQIRSGLNAFRTTTPGGQSFELTEGEKSLAKSHPSTEKSSPGDKSPVYPGWVNVDMEHEAPAVNQILNDTPIDKYNCKFYVKTYIEGHKPADKNPVDCEIKPGYMEAHGFHPKVLHTYKDLQPGDIVMVKAPQDGHIHISPVEHVAIVQKDAKGNIYLIQKPDDIHSVQRCSLKDFARYFSVSIPGPQIDVYSR